MDFAGQHILEKGGYFGITDYGILLSVLAISSLIGVVLSWTSKKKTSSEDFFLGESIGTIPTALSLTAGFVSAIELLGNPVEVYSNGTQFWLICISFVLVVPLTSYLYLPVFMKLKLTSSYEYFELRFSKHTRVLAAVMYILQMTFYASVAVYAPALALSNVTGMNKYAAVTIIYFICIFYSSQGGIKGIIMTDAFQSAVLVLSILAVLFCGYILTPGGLLELYESNDESGRFEFFIMDTNPTIRHSFWSVSIGGTFYWATMFCANQGTIQKYLSVNGLESARRALWMSSFGLILIFSVNFSMGLVLYDYFKGCDPYTTKKISALDELLPYFVINVLGQLNGISGLFVAGIFAASLGTVASAINSLSAVTMKDLITDLFGIEIPQEKGVTYSKCLSLFYGLLSLSLVFVVERLGGILQVALSFSGITGGVTLGLFSLGMLFPWANAKGAMTGGVFGLLLVGSIGLGAQYATFTTGWDPSDPKPISINECLSNYTMPTQDSVIEPLWIFRISYLWYSTIGCVATFVIGAFVSILTKPEKPYELNQELLSPPVKNFIFGLPYLIKMKLSIIKQVTNREEIFRKISLTAKGLQGISNVALIMEDEKPR